MCLTHVLIVAQIASVSGLSCQDRALELVGGVRIKLLGQYSARADFVVVRIFYGLVL